MQMRDGEDGAEEDERDIRRLNGDITTHYFSQVEVGNPRAPFQLVCRASNHPHAAMRANKGPRNA